MKNSKEITTFERKYTCFLTQTAPKSNIDLKNVNFLRSFLQIKQIRYCCNIWTTDLFVLPLEYPTWSPTPSLCVCWQSYPSPSVSSALGHTAISSSAAPPSSQTPQITPTTNRYK